VCTSPRDPDGLVRFGATTRAGVGASPGEARIPERPSITERRFERDILRDEAEATIENLVVQGAAPEDGVEALEDDPELRGSMSEAEILAEARRVQRDELKRSSRETPDVKLERERRDAWEAELGRPKTAIQQDALSLLAQGHEPQAIVDSNAEVLDEEELRDLQRYLRPAMIRSR